MKSRIALPLIIAGLAGSAWAASPAVASAASCPDAELEYAPDKGLESRVRASVFCITNVERTARGLPALTYDAHLEVGAQWHASDMARLRFYSHYAPAAAGHGVTFSERAARAGYYQPGPGNTYPVLAENIHQSPTTPYKVVADFMKSTGHCQNILNERVSQLGVGVAYGRATRADARYSHPYWAQLFGSREPEEAPAWPVNAGYYGCPYTQMVHPAPAATDKPAAPAAAAEVKAPTGTASIVTVNGRKSAAVTGSAPGLKTVRVTAGVERRVGKRTVWKPGKSVLVRVSPKTATYKAVVRVPPAPAKGMLVVRVSNAKAKVSNRIPIRTR